MLAYTFYESDCRVRRYAETLVKRGDHVDVIALRGRGREPEEVLEGVRVFRIQQRAVNEKTKFSYFVRLLLFFCRSMSFLVRKHLEHRYDLIHVHSVPDCLVFAAWFPKLRGARVILDIHDLLPEFYASKFHTTHDSRIFKLLLAVERVCSRFADYVIVANQIWQEKLLSRSVPQQKCSTFLNLPDLSIFFRRGRNRTDGKFIMLYPGTLNYHQGVDIAIRACARIKDEVPELEFHIYGAGEQKAFLSRLTVELGLEDRVLLKDLLPLTDIRGVIENADLGVVPKRKEGFGNEAFSTKILEFMSLGIPVLVSDTKVDQYYFDESLVRFFRSSDEGDLANCMLQLVRDDGLRLRLSRNGEQFIAKNNWDIKKEEYLRLVDWLVANRNGQGRAAKNTESRGLPVVAG